MATKKGKEHFRSKSGSSAMARLVEKELLSILEESIQEEKAAHDKYSRAASMAEAPEIKEMFQLLATEELKHIELLTEKYGEVKKKLGLKIMKE